VWLPCTAKLVCSSAYCLLICQCLRPCEDASYVRSTCDDITAAPSAVLQIRRNTRTIATVTLQLSCRMQRHSRIAQLTTCKRLLYVVRRMHGISIHAASSLTTYAQRSVGSVPTCHTHSLLQLPATTVMAVVQCCSEQCCIKWHCYFSAAMCMHFHSFS
jgi:hypothetical protein